MDFNTDFDTTSFVDFNLAPTFDNMGNFGQELEPDFEEVVDYNPTGPIAANPGHPEAYDRPQDIQQNATALPKTGDQVDWSTFHVFLFPDQTSASPTYDFGHTSSGSTSENLSTPNDEYRTPEYHQQLHVDNTHSYHSFLDVPVPAQQLSSRGRHDCGAATTNRPLQQGSYAANFAHPTLLVSFFF
jgi:hypothetical protein